MRDPRYAFELLQKARKGEVPLEHFRLHIERLGKVLTPEQKSKFMTGFEDIARREGGFKPPTSGDVQYERKIDAISSVTRQIKTGAIKPWVMGGAGVLAGIGLGYAGHDTIKQHTGYASYLVPHKYYVIRAGREMGLPWGRVLSHDMSKFRPDEWSAYSAWFNGPKGQYGTQDQKTFMEWREQVNKHYHRNPHHWRALHLHPNEVPVDTKLESIADWYAVQKARGNTKQNFKTWFEQRKEKFPIDKTTIIEAEHRMNKEAIATDVYRILRTGKLAVGDHVLEDGKTVIRVVKDSMGQLKYKVLGDLGEGTKLESSDIARHTKLQHHAYTKHAADKKYTSLEYTLASSNPFVKALTRNMDADKQKAVWKRYAQIVLRNRNYGRSGHVAGEYIKTKVRE